MKNINFYMITIGSFLIAHLEVINAFLQFIILLLTLVYTIIKINFQLKSNIMKKIFSRLSSPTPQFFKKLRNLGIVIATVGGSILASPVAVPAVLLTVSTYMVVAGGILGTVSQLTTNQDEKK